MRSTTCVAALCMAVALVSAGCAGKEAVPMGEVFGKVTCQGKPVEEGRISFTNVVTGDADEALLAQDGTYVVKAPLPAGDYKIMVLPLIVREKADPKGPVVGVEKRAPNIPPKYRVIATTELKASVTQGKNELDFDMKR